MQFSKACPERPIHFCLVERRSGGEVAGSIAVDGPESAKDGSAGTSVHPGRLKGCIQVSILGSGRCGDLASGDNSWHWDSFASPWVWVSSDVVQDGELGKSVGSGTWEGGGCRDTSGRGAGEAGRVGAVGWGGGLGVGRARCGAMVRDSR